MLQKKGAPEKVDAKVLEIEDVEEDEQHTSTADDKQETCEDKAE